MSNSSDPLHDRYVNMNFSDARPVDAVPALARLQAEQGNKTRVTIRLDNDVLAVFKARAEMTGRPYQTLIINPAFKWICSGASGITNRLSMLRLGAGMNGWIWLIQPLPNFNKVFALSDFQNINPLDVAGDILVG